MNETAYAALFWTAVPALMLGRRRWPRLGGGLLAAMPLGALATGLSIGHPGAFFEAGLVAAAAAAALFFVQRSFHAAARRAGDRARSLRGEVRRLRLRVEALAREVGVRRTSLERLQNRFALVQGMATRLDTAVLLQSLGELWADVQGVRGVLLLHRQPNGNWSVAFSKGLKEPEKWVHILEAYPDLTQGKRLKRHASLDRVPFLKDQGLEPPFFLVPVTWGEDVMAFGYMEVAPRLFEEGEPGFDTERKLVSIGLRRAYLYDLMSERSRHDGLTGALLRRSFLERLNETVRKSLRYKTPLFLALFDIDRFKAVNDTFGHPAGDKALVRTAHLARELSEPGVTLGRLGGDEFAVLMEMPDLDDALSWMERLRVRIAAEVLTEGDRQIRFTISAGLAAFFPERPTPEAFLEAADGALYRSKDEGRDRVTVHVPAPAPAPAAPERS